MAVVAEVADICPAHGVHHHVVAGAGGEIGEVEVAGKIFDFYCDAGGNCDDRVVAQRHFSDAAVGGDSRRDARIDFDCGAIAATDFEISGGAQDSD